MGWLGLKTFKGGVLLTSLVLVLLFSFPPKVCQAQDVVIPVVTNPYALTVTPDGQYVFVTNPDSNNVSRIVTATAQVDRTIAVGSSPRGIAATPDSAHVYAVNWTPAGPGVHCSRIETSTGTVDQTMDSGDVSQDVVVTPDGTFAYISNWNDDAVHKYSVATGGFIRSVAVGVNPEVLDVTPDGGFIFVANVNGQSISKINTATDTVVGTTNLSIRPQYGIGVTPDGQYVYVSVQNGTVVRIVVATGAIDQTVNNGANSYGLDISPDGRFVYAALYDLDQVVKIEVVTGNVVETYDVGDGPGDVCITPDGKYLFVANALDSTVTRIQLIPDGNPPGNGPSPDPIPPGGPPHQIGGGGPNGGTPQSQGNTFAANGQGGTPQGMTMALANLGAGAQATSGPEKRNEQIPGLMFQRTGPDGAGDECWLPLGETGVTPGGVEYETGVRWNYDVRVIDLDCYWPRAVIENMALGSHRLTYWLQTSEGLRSNCRVQHLVCGQGTDTAARKAPVKRNARELTFKLQVSLFNEETGFVERIKEGMCEVEVAGAIWGTFPIVDGLLTAKIPFGQTCLIKFIAQEFKGYKRVRIEFIDGFMYAYDHDFRDAVVEVYQCLDGESYAVEYYRDLVYICNQGVDPEGPILGRMFGR